MEYLFFIFVGFGIVAWLSDAFKSDKDSGSTSNQSNSQLVPLVLRVKKTTMNLDGQKTTPAISIEMMGTFETPRDGTNGKAIIQLFDVTEGDDNKYVILSLVDQLQEAESAQFEHQTSAMSLYRYTVFTEWVELLKIPIEFLLFPKKGRRKLQVVVLLTPTSISGFNEAIDTQQVFAFTEQNLSLTLNNFGYLEEDKKNLTVKEAAIELAMFVAQSDHAIATEEMATISAWAKKQVYVDNTADEQLKQSLNKSIKSSYQEVQSGKLTLQKISKKLLDGGTITDRQIALSLAVEVMASDGNADQNEMETLHTIAEKLQIEDSFFKKILADKAMRIHSGDPDAAEKMLGLTPKMSPDERKKRLLDLYRQYNSQITHNDPDIRKNAEEMLMAIAEVRRSETMSKV